MEKNQKINCTVSSCQFNDSKKKLCNLEQIIVTPTIYDESQTPEESKCSSYKNEELY